MQSVFADEASAGAFGHRMRRARPMTSNPSVTRTCGGFRSIASVKSAAPLAAAYSDVGPQHSCA